MTLYRIGTAGFLSAAIFVSGYTTANTTPLPSFLEGTGASVMTLEEMEEVQGEGVPAWARSAAVWAVKRALGNAIGAQLYNLLSRGRLPTFSDYRKAFGTRTAVILRVIPYYVRPHIVQ